jgi:hypothetical protein
MPEIGGEEVSDPYLPSNGTEMCQFYENYCSRCQSPDELLWLDKEEGSGCKYIIEATAENKQPEPWIIGDDGYGMCKEFKE